MTLQVHPCVPEAPSNGMCQGHTLPRRVEHLALHLHPAALPHCPCRNAATPQSYEAPWAWLQGNQPYGHFPDSRAAELFMKSFISEHARNLTHDASLFLLLFMK